jgi:ABC-type transport system substrate-binding protein
VSRPGTRTSGALARSIAVALCVAACGTTVQPSTSVLPTRSAPTATPAITDTPFAATAYPTAGDAPCDQAEAPDAGHAAYTGNLKRISAPDAATVTFELCRPDVAFLAKIAAPAFAINDTAWLEANIGAAAAGEQTIVSALNGTGPYRSEGWHRGSEISLARNDAYWGTPARNERLIVRWLDPAAARFVELQNATVDGIDDVDPPALSAIEDDVSLQTAPREGLNVAYLGLNATFAPLDIELVRRAIALGIDRQRLVATFFPPGSAVATHYTPCAIPHGCAGNPWYEFDPLQAKDLLATAGYKDGFDTSIRYSATPTPEVPDPAGVAGELKAQLLTNLGIRAELVVAPDDTYLPDVEAGKLDGITLLAQGVSYPDVSAYLDPRFAAGGTNAFGKPIPEVGKALADGRSTIDPDDREAAYTKANDAIRAHVPMIPIARVGSTAAFRADVDGAVASPLRLERFAAMVPGDRRQLVWLMGAEPPGLYCADETASTAALACAQFAEGLYAYDPAGASTLPALATGCDPNKKLTVWTCALRSGVKFHDGATFDADDVVLSFAVQWDAEHPLHAGHEGVFTTFASWFGGFMNPPSS